MKKIRFTVILTALLFTSCIAVLSAPFNKTNQYKNNFSDVSATQWYADSVAQVYELGLMEGVSQDTFDTDSEMTVAQAITITARLHSIYNGIPSPESIQGKNWYSDYVSYCLEHSIISEQQFDNYNRSVLSFEMVQLFAKALPESYFKKINDVESIPDVPVSADFAKEIYLFYNAGILNGNDEYGTFLPMSAITRKRAAVILARTVLSEKRLAFSLSSAKDSYSITEIFDALDIHTKKESLDEIVVASADGYEVSAAEYRYYSYISENNRELIEEYIKASASIMNAVKELNLTFPKDVLSDILSAYYNVRIQNYGTSGYLGALESQQLTDSVFARLASMNEIRYYSIKQLSESVTDDEVFDFAISNDYVCAKHILIFKNTPDAYKTALGISLELSEDSDFDELIEKYGQDPGMKARNGGYYFTKGWMVKEFEDAAYALAENEVSSVIESDYGYHIIKRLPIIKEELISSPDYPTVAANAGPAKFERAVSALQDTVTVIHNENFESFASTLD